MIYVVRHGQTDWNKEGKLQGRSGMPLNDEGLFQAKNLAKKLQSVTFDYVYSSPQERAVQTAEIASGRKAVIDTRLDVFDLGDADGLERSNVKMAGIVPDPNFYKGVEDVREFLGRVFSFMKELEKRHSADEANILIAGHRCTTGCMGAFFEGMPSDGNLLKLASSNGEYKVYVFNRQG